MFEEFRDWLISIIGTEYTPFQGTWVDDSTSSDSYYCVFQYGGGAPSVEVRYPTITVLLLGRRGKRGDGIKIGKDAETIMQHVVSGTRTVPCGAANVRALREPVGVGYTTEDRAWYSLDFEIIV